MSVPLTDIRIGQPVRFGSLSVFPLFRPEHRPIDYLLSEDAMTAGWVVVREVSEQGSVPELFVENQADRRILFLEGEELRGAKQNRILNTSVLVPAHTKLKVPVSCVEAGRWRRTSAYFSSSKHMSPSHLRHSLKSSVTRSLKAKQGHRSDQSQVWKDVRTQQEALNVSSHTSALADTYARYEKDLEEAEQALQYVTGAVGMVVAIGERIVSADLFDQPATCEKVWSKLLSGIVLDALVDKNPSGPPEPPQVEQFVQEVCTSPWTQTEAVGEGQEYRAEYAGKVGSALVLDGALVHGSVLAGVG